MVFVPREENRVPGLVAMSVVDGVTPVVVYADPTTHRLYADVTISSATVTGAKSNNGGVPGATNLGVLPGVATAAAPTHTEGNQVALSTDLSGALRVTGSLSVGGTTDNSAYTAGSSTGTPAMGFYHSTIDTVTDGRAASIAISSKRGMHVTLHNDAGTIVGDSTTPMQVSLANTGANATAIKVDGSAVTQPVSGTVSITANSAVNVAQVNGVTVLMGNGITGTGSQRVTIASDNTAFTVNPASATTPVSTMNSASAAAGVTSAMAAVFDDVSPTAITENSFGYVRMSTNRNQYVTIRDAAGNERGLNIDASGQLAVTIAAAQTIGITANSSVNVAQMNGVAVSMGSGINGTGVQRVTLATDQAAVTTTGLFSVKIDQTTVGTTNAVSVAQINAAATLAGNGVTGTGSQRVTLASDNTGIANFGHGATAASVPAGVTYAGRRGTTALPTAVTDGQSVGSMADKFGRTVSLIGTIRDLTGTQTTTISASTSETTIVTAGAAGIFNDLVMLIISNTSASTNTRIDFRDATAGTILFSLQSNGGQPPVGFALAIPVPQTTAANNWTAQCATSTTDVRIYAVFAKNK